MPLANLLAHLFYVLADFAVINWVHRHSSYAFPFVTCFSKESIAKANMKKVNQRADFDPYKGFIFTGYNGY